MTDCDTPASASIGASPKSPHSTCLHGSGESRIAALKRGGWTELKQPYRLPSLRPASLCHAELADNWPGRLTISGQQSRRGQCTRRQVEKRTYCGVNVGRRDIGLNGLQKIYSLLFELGRWLGCLHLAPNLFSSEPHRYGLLRMAKQVLFVLIRLAYSFYWIDAEPAN